MNHAPEPDQRRLLPAVTTFEASMSYAEYVDRLAQINDCTTSQVLAWSLRPSSTILRNGSPRLLNDLAARTGTDLALLLSASPARFPKVVTEHWLTGFIDPDSPSNHLVVDLLPHDSVGWRIRTDLAASDTNDHPLLTYRLRMLNVITRIGFPPTGREALTTTPRYLWRLVKVDGDPSRAQPVQQWSPLVRAAALYRLWDATYPHDSVAVLPADPAPGVLMERVRRRWSNTAVDLSLVLPALSRHLEIAAAHLGQVPDPAMRPVRVEHGGPFSVPALPSWRPEIIRTLHAIDTAMHHGHPAGTMPPTILRPTPSGRVSAARFDQLTHPRELSLELRHLHGTPTGREVLAAARRVVLADPAPLPLYAAAAWWTAKAPHSTARLLSALPVRLRRRTKPWMLLDLIWIDLTGHLPADPDSARTLTAWQVLAQQIPADALLHLRTTVLDWAGLTETLRSTDVITHQPTAVRRGA